MDFGEHYNRSLRLALLRLLKEAPGYKANSSLLHTTAGQLGFHVSRDKVLGQLDWLAEQSLINAEELGSMRVCEITQRGLDVANGQSSVTGVDRPSPKG
jgi:hypothetical protein